ncbi:asialoglycoprotein receptor 1-like [Latimeria chalumnae]|uniref:asialoglycoprotein receptor 1-like n=1 Tax=Latimeria chalumnae TaxID=7897 RepID=UPI00313E6BC3
MAFPASGLSRPVKLLYGLVAIIGFLLLVMVITVAVKDSRLNQRLKETQSNTESLNLSLYSALETKQQADKALQQEVEDGVNYAKSLESLLKKEKERFEEELQNINDAVHGLTCDVQILQSNGTQKSCCKHEWVRFAGSCYFISKQTKSWDDARNFCIQQGSHLVVTNTDEEQDFLRSRTVPYYTWIGLTDSMGDWHWEDGTNYSLTPHYWLPNQPDDFYGHGLEGGEDCAHMHGNGRWNDDHCSRRYRWVCEKKLLI